jgi:sulfatase maturation enzyme AslB (radical SAM superfamily)
MPVPAGNAAEASSQEIWNSAAALEIRRSILDGSFRYCSWLECPYIAARKLPARTAETVARYSLSVNRFPFENGNREQETGRQLRISGQSLPVKSEGPQELVLSHDPSCHLACPQCRHHFFFAGPRKRERLDELAEKFLAPVLSAADTLRLTGAGELFASKYCRQLLQRLDQSTYPKLHFRIVTNGLGFDRQTFEEFGLHRRIRSITVAIDAASEETYRVVRRGGDFDRLRRNLEFLSVLRGREGEDFSLVFTFVVSALNFWEMPAFVRLAKQYGADAVEFSRLRNQSGYSTREFKALNIANPGHPEYGNFREVLRADELSGSYCRWGNLAYLQPASR